MKKIYRRVLAMGLSLALAVTSVPTAVFATEHVEAEDAVVLPEESEHIETAPEQAEAGDASAGDVTVEGIETTGSSDQTSVGETGGEAQSDTGNVTYAKKTASVSGSFYLVAEHSADKKETDALAVAPVCISYEPGDTILSAINRISGMECTEQFGENVEDGSVYLNGEAYVATCDTHTGLITLSDMLSPEEVNVIRLHQNRDGEESLDYFPTELQALIKAMAQDGEKGSDAYRAAETDYAAAVQDPELAAAFLERLTEESESEETEAADESDVNESKTETSDDSESADGAENPEPETLASPESGSTENSAEEETEPQTSNSTDETESLPETESETETEEALADTQAAEDTVAASVQAAQDGQTTFAVVFHVTYNGAELSDATITLKNAAGQELAGTDKYNFALHKGWYDYTIEKKDYETIQGRFQVEDQDQTIEAEMIPSRDQKYEGVLTLTCKGEPVENAITTLKNVQTGATKTYQSDENGQVKYELYRGAYTWSVYKKQRYGYTVAHENTYRQIYEESTGNFEVTKDTAANRTEIPLTKIRYPHITDVLFANETSTPVGISPASHKDYTDTSPAYNDGGAPFEDGITYTLTIPDYDLGRFCVEFRWDDAMETENRSITVRYQNQSINEMTVIENFPVKMYTKYELYDFVSLAKGGGRLTVETKVDEEVEVFYIDVKIPRTLRSLKAQEDGNILSLIPEFSPTVTEYTLDVPVDTEILDLTPRMFQGERAGYQLTINGEAAASGKTAQVALSEANAQTISVTVSHTDGQQTTYQIHVKRMETISHQITFSLFCGEDAVTDALLTVMDAAGNVMEPEDGYRYRLVAGTYTYRIQRDGSQDETGSFGVGSQDQDIPIYLVQNNAKEHLLKELKFISGGGEYDLELKSGVYEYWIYTPEYCTPSIIATLSDKALIQQDSKLVMQADGKETELISGIKTNTSIDFDEANPDRTKILLYVSAGGDSQTYTFHMLEQPRLSKVSLSAGGKVCNLTSTMGTGWETTINSQISTAYLSVTPHSWCNCREDMTILINGTELASGVLGKTIRLSDEEIQQITITLICNRTGTERTYTVTINKKEMTEKPMLKRLSFEGSTGIREEYLEFQPDVYFYQVDVPDIDSISTYVSAELDDAYADGTIELSYIYSDGRSNSFRVDRFPMEISPKIGNGRLETLTVTAVSQDGQEHQDYMIQVGTRSFFKNLQVLDEDETKLTLSPNGFHFSQLNYTVYIPEKTKKVTVRATAYSTTTQMELDGMVFLGSATLPADGKKHSLRIWQEDGDSITEYTLQTQVVRTIILTAQCDGKVLLDGIKTKEFCFYDENSEKMQESYNKTTALGVNGSHVFELPDGTYTWKIELYGYEPVSGEYTVNGKDDEIVADLKAYPAGNRTVEFQIRKDGTEVDSAEIQLTRNGQSCEEGQIAWNAWHLPDGGGYHYAIYVSGCAVYTGDISVNGEDQKISVDLSPSPGDIQGESRTVYLTLAKNGTYLTDSNGEAIFRRKLTVDYFDLSQYLLQDYFCYTDSEKTTVSGTPTWLHLLIAAEEQLRGSTVKKETEALTLTKTGELTSYWGWNQYFLIAHGSEYECEIGTGVLTDLLEDGEEIRIDFTDWNPRTSGDIYLTVPFTEDGEREATIQQGMMQRFQLRTRYAYNSVNHLHNLQNAYLELRQEGSTEWKRIDTKSDENGLLSVYFGTPGTWYVRIAEPYPSGTTLSKAAQVIRYETVVHVEACPQNPVETTFCVTMQGEDVTNTAQITVTDADGTAMEDTGTAGSYALIPGIYTYEITASDADGTFTKTGSFYTLSDGVPVSITEELREALYLREISVASMSHDTKQWKSVFTEDEKKDGKFDYHVGLEDDGRFLYFYIRPLLNYDLTDKAKITAEYANTKGEKVQSDFSYQNPEGHWIRDLFPYQFSLDEEKEIVLRVTYGDTEQVYHLGIYRIPTIQAITAQAGDRILTPELDQTSHTCQLTVGEDTETVSVRALAPSMSRAAAEITIDGDVAENGTAVISLNPEGDTTVPMTVRWKEPIAYGGTAEQSYTLTIHRTKEADPGEQGVLEDLSIYRSGASGTDKKYTLTPAFSPDVYDYTITMKDSESTIDLYTAVAKEAQEDANITIRSIDAQSGELQSVEADLTGATENRIRNVRTAYGADGQVVNVIVSCGDSQRTYVIHIQADRKLEYLRVKEKGMDRSMTLTPNFSRTTYEYEAVAQSYTTAVEVRGGCIGKSFLENGYHLSINGTEIDTYDQIVEVPLKGHKTQIPVQLWYGDGEPLTYTVTVIRNIPAEVTFHMTPAESNLQLSDANGELLYPVGIQTTETAREIHYTLSAEETYRWTASGAGYIGQSGEFEAADGALYEITLQAAEKNPDIRDDMDAEWGDFRGEDNNAVTSAPTPKKAEDAMLYWAVKSGEGWDGTAASPPILVDGYLYFYAGNRLLQMDKATGKVLKTAQMVGRSSFSINPPTYGDGMIFVALSGGVIQAFNAATMESLWVFHDTFGTEFGSNQPNSPVIYRNGYVYTGFWNNEEQPGHFVCLSATDEDPHNQTEEKYPMWVRSQAGGFYWAGAYASDHYILVGTDDGQFGSSSQTGSLLSMDPISGVLLDTLEGLNGDIRSTVMYDEATSAYYFTSKGGSFYQVKVNADGTFRKESLRAISLSVDGKAAMSTSTPVICNGRAYVGYSGGGQFTAYDHHGIAVIDLAQFAIAYTANTKGYPQTSGLLAKEGDVAYVYFVDNYTPGMIRVIQDQPGQTALADPATETWTKDGKTQTVQNCAPVLFTPGSDHAEYAISSLIADSDGTLYFKNDSNYMFALGSAIDHLEVTQQPEKQTYIKGETFDPSGMKVEAVYKNGIRRDVTDRITLPDGKLSEKDVSVRIRYTYGLYNDTNADKTVYTDISIRVVKDAGALRALEAIQAIRAIGDVTLEKEDLIKAARAAYDAVPEAQKDEVVNYFLLERAEQTLTKLKGDQASLTELEQKIRAIGEVTLEKEAQINEARSQYNSFPDELRAQVPEELYQILTAAEKELDRLKTQKDVDDRNDSSKSDGDEIDPDGTENGGTKTDPKPSPSITDNKPSNTGTSGNGNTGKKPGTSTGSSGSRPTAGGNRVQASGSITGGSSGGIRKTTTGGSATGVQRQEGVISRESGTIRDGAEAESESEGMSEQGTEQTDATEQMSEDETETDTETDTDQSEGKKQLATAGVTKKAQVTGLSAPVLYGILGAAAISLLLLLLAAWLLQKRKGKENEEEDDDEWDE